MNDLISVIIPVYKVERHLRDCLESILASTHRNLEIILVDDGSPDNCGRICDEYAAKDDRVSVIHQMNQGLSGARNSGLAAAKGDFIAFVDSDDKISPVMFDTLLWAMKHTNSDMAACECARNEESLMLLHALEPESLRIVSGTDDCIRVVSGEPSFRPVTWTGPMVTNKLYCKQIINAKFRRECVPAEDIQFNWEILENCNNMVIVPLALYYYRINLESITNNPSVNKRVTIANVWINIAKNDMYSKDLQTHLHYRAASSAHSALCKIVMSNQETDYQEFCDQAFFVVKRYFRDLISHEDTSIHMKVVYILCRYCNPLWKLLLKAYKRVRRAGSI